MSTTDFRFNYNNMPQASMSLDRELRFKNANRAYCRAVHRDLEDLVGKHVFEAMPDTAERMKPVQEVFERTLQGEITRLKLVPYQLATNGQIEDRLWDIENQPLYSTDGEIIGLVQYCEDVTDRETLRQERDLVTAELMHRVRNSMAVVQSVAEHTGQASSNIDEFLQGFHGRLSAMSRNFTMLCDANWRGLDFKSVLLTELEPHLDEYSDKVILRGPEFQLSVKSTKDAAMIFHELITNASKYGFLSVPDGQVEIDWDFDGDHFHVRWNESGLENLQPPTRIGFGFQMMDMFPNMSLTKTFAPDGLKLAATIPAHIVAGEITFGKVRAS